MNSKEKVTNDNSVCKKPIRSDIAIVVAIYCLLTLFLPVFLFFLDLNKINSFLLQGISLAVCIISVIAFLRLIGSKHSRISYILTTVALLFLLGSVLCAIIISFVASVFILAYLLIYCKRPATRILALSPAAVAYIISSFVIGSFLSASVVFIHLPMAIMLAYAISRKFNRVRTICYTSAGFILALSAIAAVTFLLNYGTDLSVIGQLITSLKERAISFMANTLYSVYSEVGYTLSLTDATDLSRLAISSVFNLLPAIIVVISNILAFILQSMMINVFVSTDSDKEKIQRFVRFDMSLVSAIVFFLMLFIALFLSESEPSVFSVTAENVSFILMPGLIYIAFATLRSFVFSKKASCFGVLLYLLPMYLFFRMPSIMLSLGSVAGAVIIILNSIANFKRTRNK